jgi:hypothetical protein
MYQTHLPDPIVSQKVEAEDPAAITTTFVVSFHFLVFTAHWLGFRK